MDFAADCAVYWHSVDYRSRAGLRSTYTVRVTEMARNDVLLLILPTASHLPSDHPGQAIMHWNASASLADISDLLELIGNRANK